MSSHQRRRQQVVQAHAQVLQQLDATTAQAAVVQDGLAQSLSPTRLLGAGLLSGCIAGLLPAPTLPLRSLRALPSLLAAWQQLQHSLGPAAEVAAPDHHDPPTARTEP